MILAVHHNADGSVRILLRDGQAYYDVLWNCDGIVWAREM